MGSFSIEAWCGIHGFSRAFFYKLNAQGKAPRTFRVGATTRISEAANNEWLAACEAVPADDEAAAKRTAIGRKNVSARRDRQAA
jgi:predicted DNA-binding transcriptional regulator AlpA